MSSVTERKPENRTTRYKFTCTDDEIIDDKFLQLSDDKDTWLCKTDCHSGRKSFIEGQINFHNENSPLDSSCRHIDSRTYTRRKRCSFQPGFESCWELEMHNKTPINNTSIHSSPGILTPSLFNKTQGTDLLHHILKFTPTPKQALETDSFDSIGSEETHPRLYKLDISSLTPIVSNIQHRTNCVINTTFDKLQTDSVISEIPAPSFSNINTPESSMHNSLITIESNESPECFKTGLDNLPSLNEDILHSTYEAENIAPAFNLNTSVVTDKQFNVPNVTKMCLNSTQTMKSDKSFSTTNLTKSPLNTTLTISPNRAKTLSLLNGDVNSQLNLTKSPLNTTFSKPQLTNAFSKSLNNTFTKSVDALNGTEDDQNSSASDSSFSSCSNLPRSVGDLHTIARLQEESLEEQEPNENSTPKSDNAQPLVNGKCEKCGSASETLISTPKTKGMQRSQADGIISDESLSPIRKYEDGNLSDHSEQSSGSSLSTYSNSSHNNNTRILSPSSSLMRDNLRTQLPVSNSTNSNISRPKASSSLRMPVAVSQMPVSRMRPPSVHSTVIRPTPTSTNIPRPTSRLPAPRFRGRVIPKQNN